MINYSITSITNQTTGKSVYFALPQFDQTIDTKVLAKRISKQCTVSYADTLAVLESVGENLRDFLQEGCQVELYGIGKMRVGLKSETTSTAEEFTSNNIKDVFARFVPDAELKNLLTDAEFNLVGSRKNQALVREAAKTEKQITIVGD